jgi:rhamnose utilization protein RhaD (predicted bifunctional aldolase and dehydrogenase)
LPGVEFVGHTHPIAVNSLLCSPLAETFATRRLFPDEIVCCGQSSVLVPYTDPGLKLAQAIRAGTQEFITNHGIAPRVILLKNHGIITFGPTPESVKAATYMAVKAARIFLGAAALGGPVFLSDADVDRIANRRDEHHRQKALGL